MTEQLRAYVMMRRRSRQLISPACVDWTSPASMAAARMRSHPLASHAAGQVTTTSAASIGRQRVATRTSARECECLLRSATAPISRVISSFAYSHRHVRKSTIRFIAVLPGCQKGKKQV